MRPIGAVFVVSVLLVALAAGAALAANITCTPGAPTCEGTPSPDQITGTNGADNILAGGGEDTVRALMGDDRVDGFNGNDTISGGRDDDLLIGAEDSDIVSGERGNDTVDLASFDNPAENPEAPVDRGFGGRGNDRIEARDGNRDIINCGPGRDRAFRDPGVDTTRNCEVLRP